MLRVVAEADLLPLTLLLSPPLFFAAAGLLQSLGIEGNVEAEVVEDEEGFEGIPLEVLLLLPAELTPFEVIVMPKRFLTAEGLAGVGFLGLGSVVGRDCLLGEGLERDEVVDETGERREVGSPRSSSASAK